VGGCKHAERYDIKVHVRIKTSIRERKREKSIHTFITHNIVFLSMILPDKGLYTSRILNSEFLLFISHTMIS